MTKVEQFQRMSAIEKQKRRDLFSEATARSGVVLSLEDMHDSIFKTCHLSLSELKAKLSPVPVTGSVFGEAAKVPTPEPTLFDEDLDLARQKIRDL